MELTNEIKNYFSEIGKKGGKSLLEKRGKDYFKKIRAKRKTWKRKEKYENFDKK